MKPVAKVARNGHYIRAVFNGTGKILPSGTTLFTADQLRKAKVEVLREAADRLMNCGEEFGAKHLLIMADEIEKGEQ